jgi:O-antigen chain-terminating methyltransferase
LRLRIGDLPDPRLEQLYVALEDRFRGAREEIKERFRVYLPYVQGRAPVIDLGCGRGEWLELLRDNGNEARGVRWQQYSGRAVPRAWSRRYRTGRVRLSEKHARRECRRDHGISHYRALPFPRVLMDLLNEVMRVLRPGGIAIFETPKSRKHRRRRQLLLSRPDSPSSFANELMEFLFKNHGFEES